MIGAYTIPQLVIFAIIAISVIGILFVVAKANGVAIPGWVVQIGWIVLLAIVAIFGVKLVMSMG